MGKSKLAVTSFVLAMINLFMILTIILGIAFESVIDLIGHSIFMFYFLTFPMISLVGLILGIISLFKFKKDPKLEGKKLGIIGLVVNGLTFTGISIIFVMAMNNLTIGSIF